MYLYFNYGIIFSKGLTQCNCHVKMYWGTAMDLTKIWYRNEFVQSENLDIHRKMENEFAFYISVAKGDIEAVKANCNNNTFSNPIGMGKLSENELQNIRYHFVITAAMVTRFCVSYGMELERAYSLSDFYILEMDKCTSIEQISKLHDIMCLDLCNKMLVQKNNQILSKSIILSLDYIYQHINDRITVKELANNLSISENYLSRLFKKEMGISVSEYILSLKIEKACNLLQFSEYSIADIASYLSFASQSHFIQVFQKIMGQTPKKYRQTHFRKNW
ncbi:MAG: AraC family transcriptional regulator [Wujia sp.]